MTPNTTIVTSVYYNCAGEPYYCSTQHGIPRTLRYIMSLDNIVNMGYPVVCYTSKEFGCYDELYNYFFVDRKVTNLTLKIYELPEYVHHSRILELRAKYPKYNDRYFDRPIEIYWSKFTFLKQELDTNEYVYWMDAGLSSYMNFPKRLSTGRLPVDKKCRDSIFDFSCYNDTLFDRINTYAQDRIVNLGRAGTSDADASGLVQIKKLITDKYTENLEIYNKTPFHPVAGFFGGSTKTSNIKQYVNEFEKLAVIAVEHDELCVEEALMWYLNILHRSDNWFRNYYFENFYTEDETNPRMHTREDGSIIHHFYRFFEDDIIIDEKNNNWS
jgi:hypothetical protein